MMLADGDDDRWENEWQQWPRRRVVRLRRWWPSAGMGQVTNVGLGFWVFDFYGCCHRVRGVGQQGYWDSCPKLSDTKMLYL
ncbi:hypothetical protein M6B38_102470 [Iris pallida]|uniref:Uncharacterized protein n=1 Tax=Iris pallida TaxID=29817 RepID=A0AAX6G6B1_IRIPA|nr:hypothetical protein M6B38_102470 [Iris pallida]